MGSEKRDDSRAKTRPMRAVVSTFREFPYEPANEGEKEAATHNSSVGRGEGAIRKLHVCEESGEERIVFEIVDVVESEGLESEDVAVELCVEGWGSDW